MVTLIENLDLLARRDYGALKRRCAVDDEDLADMIAEIRALDPKPALAYDHKVAEPVVPDVFVRRRGPRQLDRRAEQRHAAAGAGQSPLLQ